MPLLRHYFTRVLFFLLFMVIVSMTNSIAQSQNRPVSNPLNRDLLDHYGSRAGEYVSKNLNRLAYEELQKYNYILDSLYSKEKNDTIALIEKNYKINASAILSNIENQKKEIEGLTVEKEKLENKYWSLVKKAVLAFVVWLAIVILLILFRKGKLNKNVKHLANTNIQTKVLEEFDANAEVFFNFLLLLKEPFKKLRSEYGKLNDVVTENLTNKEVPSEWKDIIQKTNIVKKSVEKEESILNAIISQSGSLQNEKVNTDINALCDHYLEIATRGIQAESDFGCQVTKDFEKNIPVIKIIPEATGTLLLNILMNAFQSVKEKSKSNIKGYQPKVSISSRILPRFIQLRVKDNGTGMSDEILEQVKNEFYTTRPLPEGSGLGLSVANSIISEMHKGEIKIESENGNGTDVYIKFFT